MEGSCSVPVSPFGESRQLPLRNPSVHHSIRALREECILYDFCKELHSLVGRHACTSRPASDFSANIFAEPDSISTNIGRQQFICYFSLSFMAHFWNLNRQSSLLHYHLGNDYINEYLDIGMRLSYF